MGISVGKQHGHTTPWFTNASQSTYSEISENETCSTVAICSSYRAKGYCWWGNITLKIQLIKLYLSTRVSVKTGSDFLNLLLIDDSADVGSFMSSSWSFIFQWLEPPRYELSFEQPGCAAEAGNKIYSVFKKTYIFFLNAESNSQWLWIIL